MGDQVNVTLTIDSITITLIREQLKQLDTLLPESKDIWIGGAKWCLQETLKADEARAKSAKRKS